MKTTKKQLQRLVSEVVQKKKTTLTESKSHDGKIKVIIREELRKLRGLLKENNGKPQKLKPSGLIRPNNPKNFKSLNIYGFPANLITIKRSKATPQMSVQYQFINTFQGQMSPATQQKLAEMLGAIALDATATDGYVVIKKDAALIKRIIDKFGGDQNTVTQKLEIVVPEGVEVFIDGKKIS